MTLYHELKAIRYRYLYKSVFSIAHKTEIILRHL